MNTQQPLGSFGRRAAAMVVDYLVIYPLALLFAFLGASTHQLALVGVGLAYFVLGGGVYLLVGWRMGRTLGMRLVGLRVVSCSNDGRITWSQSATRLVGFVLASIPWGLGLFATLWNRRRQGWHDRLAATLVVRG